MPFRIRTSISSIETLWLSSLFISISRLYVSKICRWYLEKPTNQAGHSACFPEFITSPHGPALQRRHGGSRLPRPGPLPGRAGLLVGTTTGSARACLRGCICEAGVGVPRPVGDCPSSLGSLWHSTEVARPGARATPAVPLAGPQTAGATPRCSEEPGFA